MIVSGIWWKRVDAPLRALTLTSLVSLLTGCGVEQLLFGRPSSQEPPPLPPPSRSSGSQTDVSAGLSPLPTPQQVLTAVPFGRRDPFAPLPAPASAGVLGSVASAASVSGSGVAAAVPAAAASGASAAAAGSGARPAAAAPARLTPPKGFQLSGVIRTGGRAEALVSYGSLSGSLRPGDRGGRNTALLPPGWSLDSIQFGGYTPLDPPSITLQYGPQRVRVRL